MKLKGSGFRDMALFGRVLSTGLVVAGYAFLGVWLSRWLENNDYPGWLAVAAMPAALFFGLWQGWLCLKRLTRKDRTGIHKDDI